MFKDLELKLNFHKERITQDFIKRGIYPNNKLIQSQLNNIELRLAIFNATSIKEGSVFSTKLMNEALKDIYNDLCMLYKLLYSLTVIEYKKLENYISSHIHELGETANMYLKRAELESYSCSLGNSILFKHNNFDINKIDDYISVNLGTLAINDTSKIVCIADINNVDHENIIFEFANETDTVHCNSYTYNRDYVIFPGFRENKEHIISISNNQKINSMLELPLVVQDVETSSFVTLAGKNKITCKTINDEKNIYSEDLIDVNDLVFKEHSYIDFYVINGQSINFRFNKKPLATNFNINEDRIDNLDYIHHFFIEADADFAFNIEIERGSIYAFKENTIINQDKLFYSGKINVNDFLVSQSMPGELKTYNVVMKAYNSSISEDDINSIMIKKIQ